VVKEAYLKALGLGLRRPLDSFTVRGLGERWPRIDDAHDTGRGWEVDLRRVTDSHVMAVALAARGDGRGRTPIRVLDFADFLRARAIEPVEKGRL